MKSFFLEFARSEDLYKTATLQTLAKKAAPCGVEDSTMADDRASDCTLFACAYPASNIPSPLLFVVDEPGTRDMRDPMY
jgi:hypothetical protein